MKFHSTRTYVAKSGFGQVHTFEGNRNNLLNLGFHDIHEISHGHHARSGGGRDVFNFQNLDQVRNVVVGRLEDFDSTRDRITLEGVELDLDSLPEQARIVAFAGMHNDQIATKQQWLLIDTGAGKIFYALEGVRVDMNHDGGSNSGKQESHFLTVLPDFDTLPDVAFIEQNNQVPLGYLTDGGVVINDTDKVAEDVREVILGTAGGDLIAGGLNDDTIRGGGGNDTIWGGSGADRIAGAGGKDLLYGGTGADLIFAHGNDDVLYGGHDSDTLYGGTGQDSLSGDDGNDVLHGNAGFDLLRGGAGSDVLFGGAQADKLFGDRGDDKLIGGGGLDRLFGGGGDDTLRGGNARDTFLQGPDSDLLVGGSGNDRLLGGWGNDVLKGGDGNDSLFGGAGFDTLYADAGDDIMVGNFNADVFVFSSKNGAFGNDTIMDFDVRNAFERIDLSAVQGISNFADLIRNHSVQDSRTVVIDAQAFGTIRLVGATLTDLEASDFEF